MQHGLVQEHVHVSVLIPLQRQPALFVCAAATVEVKLEVLMLMSMPL